MILKRWACLASLALGAAAGAQPRPIVALTFLGGAEDRTAFTSSLSELVMRLDIDLVTRETDAPLPKDALLAVVTADWTAQNEVTVTILDARQKVVLVRRLSRTSTPSVVIEAATHIVQSVIEELAIPAPLSPPPVLSSEPPRLPLPVAPSTVAARGEERETGIAFDIGAFFGGRAFGGRDGPSIQPGGGLQLALNYAGGRWRPGGWFSAEYQAPIFVHADLLDFAIHPVALRLGAGFTAIGGDSWRLDVGVGGGADLFFTTHPFSRELPMMALERDQVGAAPIFTALAGFHLAVARSSDVWLAFSLDVDLYPRRWVVANGPGIAATELYAPSRVRPSLLLGFSFNTVGPEPYVSRVGGGQ